MLAAVVPKQSLEGSEDQPKSLPIFLKLSHVNRAGWAARKMKSL